MKRTKQIVIELLSIIMLCLIIGQQLNAQQAENKPSIFDELYQKEVLKMTMELPWQYLRNHRRDTNEYKAILSFSNKSGVQQQWMAEVELRGKFRRMRCAEMPPLKIKFKKKQLKAAGLSKHNDLKLVSYCQDDSLASKEALIKEYLAYKLYNEVTAASYRVQLVEMTYKDSYSGVEKTQFAFLIEDNSQLRERLGASKQTAFRYISAEDFTQEDRQNVAVFQYMIGNSDWTFTSPRNIKYLKKNNKIIPIPYDFDFSGFVNARYAVPAMHRGQTKLTDRIWLGFSEDEYLLKKSEKTFSELQAKFFELINSTEELTFDSRRKLIHYISTYYKEIPVSTDIVQIAE